MGYLESNNSTIDRAFARLSASKEKAISDGMYLLLDAALDYLHEAHADTMHHENESNTLGWALIHNGTIVDAVSQAKGEFTPRGDVLDKLQQIASGVTRNGWVGIVASDVENGWYRVDWEMGYLLNSANRVRANFHKFFKKI